ncbi:unnamed protein product [Zymoseptoria tritici ST99CH_1A5]|uniref:Uncharacterized protein n=1 Tax=Zymoseptoria tritici ST99CH_1A5 TaxID=1276529 RepID=A0A1Y6M2T3_ZYMTR|nr:unnamed protein product [Zymoseptoria tritici ST99CH_3D1]SMY30050.1 unnamed protein product [Zymoseptoria tritici ST99CH_1A5]
MAPVPPRPSTPTTPSAHRRVAIWSPGRITKRQHQTPVSAVAFHMASPGSPPRPRGGHHRIPPPCPSPLVEAVMKRLDLHYGKCVSKSTTKQETRCTRLLGTRPNTHYLVSALVAVMQQPTIIPAHVVHAYLMLLGVASCKDHALGQHVDHGWFMSHLLQDIWAIHECIRLCGIDAPEENPSSLLRPMEPLPAVTIDLLPIHEIMVQHWLALAQIMPKPLPYFSSAAEQHEQEHEHEQEQEQEYKQSPKTGILTDILKNGEVALPATPANHGHLEEPLWTGVVQSHHAAAPSNLNSTLSLDFDDWESFLGPAPPPTPMQELNALYEAWK